MSYTSVWLHHFLHTSLFWSTFWSIVYTPRPQTFCNPAHSCNYPSNHPYPFYNRKASQNEYAQTWYRPRQYNSRRSISTNHEQGSEATGGTVRQYLPQPRARRILSWQFYSVLVSPCHASQIMTELTSNIFTLYLAPLHPIVPSLSGIPRGGQVPLFNFLFPRHAVTGKTLPESLSYQQNIWSLIAWKSSFFLRLSLTCWSPIWPSIPFIYLLMVMPVRISASTWTAQCIRA